ALMCCSMAQYSIGVNYINVGGRASSARLMKIKK
ncbi:MAG: hypothetical protein RLZZ387_2702, partial [Chloroflexota bacterium]